MWSKKIYLGGIRTTARHLSGRSDQRLARPARGTAVGHPGHRPRVSQRLSALLPPVRVRTLATRLRASLSIGVVWIRQAKELNMKRLLGLLLVIVGCGGGGR